MGALLAYQPRPEGSGAAADAFARARAWIETGAGLRPQDEATGVVKYARANGPATPLARDDDGWLALVGTWTHPDAATATELRALGAGAFDALDGHFAAAWKDRGLLHVLPDPLGRLHVFFAEGPDGVFVSTSPLALAAAVSPEPDPDAAAEFLASGNLYEDRTPFRHVRRLQGGRAYRFRAGRLDGADPVPAFRVPPDGPGDGPGGGTGGGTVDGLLDRCAEATALSVRPFARPLADLTGGLDSRIVAGLLRRAGRRVDVTVTGPERSADVRCAKRLAARLGLTMLHEPATTVRDARSSFERVLAAAARTEGMYDAVEYAGIAAMHEAHAATHEASVNGSGGEVFRNYWWGGDHVGAPGDAVALALRRFASLCLKAPFLAPTNMGAHFRAVLERTLAGRAGADLPTKLDHVYLHLRMQCWQGAIASATNRIWPSFSPLMLRGVLGALYRLDPRVRLDGGLIHDLLRRLGRDLASVPLATGFPPQAPGLFNAWRFVPGLCAVPGKLWARLQARRLRRGASDDAGARAVRALCADGAADWLAPDALALDGVDRKAYALFLETARASGRVAPALLGRLIALEFALRRAREAARAGAPAS